MGEINDDLFHCSAHCNTRKPCWNISVDGIIHFRPSYAHAASCAALSSFPPFCFREIGAKGTQSRLRFCFPAILSI